MRAFFCRVSLRSAGCAGIGRRNPYTAFALRKVHVAGGEDEAMRINKLMVRRGVCSRREANDYVKRGLVRVDGQIATLGQMVRATAEVELLSAAREEQAQKVTIMLHKPLGWVSQNADASPAQRQKLAIKLLTWSNRDRSCGAKVAKAVEPYKLKGLGVVGRLDAESRGLLLFSEDGNVARALVHQCAMPDKEYLVTVRVGPAPRPGAVGQGECELSRLQYFGRRSQGDFWLPGDERENDAKSEGHHHHGEASRGSGDLEGRLAKLRSGIHLDDKPLKCAVVELVSPVCERGGCVLRIVLREGKYRQIRRMCEVVGLKVVDLFRRRLAR